MDKELRPFQRYNFFLDLKNCPQMIVSLTEKIQQLGGNIDSFLSKKVNYVVTNRPRSEWPKSIISNNQSSTPSIVMNSNVATFSRGKMLLAKSTQVQPKTTDTLELARNWRLKIISANEMIEFCKKHVKNFQEQQQPDVLKPIENSRVLAPPYIKVVDNSFKYKTNFKELSEWPELNFEYQPELCPFYKRKAAVLPQQNNNPNNNISQQSNKSTTINLGTKQFNDKCTVLTTPILTPTFNFTKSIPTRNTSKRRHTIFCEICHKDYDDFEQHLNTETHANFLNNDENFSELLSVINSLQPFMKPVNTFKNNRFSDNNNSNNYNDNKKCSNDSNDNEPPQTAAAVKSHNTLPLSEISNRDNHSNANNILANSTAKELGVPNKKSTPSPPSMMRSIHSINTWGSGSKSRTFVALHDLINNKSNDNSSTENKQPLQPIMDNNNQIC